MKAAPRDRARAYALNTPPAVAGASGHSTTFKLAAKLVRGFALSLEEALQIMMEWNQHCDPPWTESELRHKLKDADQHGTEARGSMLTDATDYRSATPTPRTEPPRAPQSAKDKPDRTGFTQGTPAQIRTLATSRPYLREGLELANHREFLVFGPCCGFDSYALADKSGWVLEARRIDGQPFPKTDYLNERKSHAIKGSRKAWPVGILEAAEFSKIALVEGMPDFLSACYEAVWEGKEEHCGVVAMLSSSPAIAEAALPHFRGKHVRLFPHSDAAGIKGASNWKKQLQDAGATKVDIFDFSQYQKPEGGRVSDFWEAFHPTSFYPAIKLPERMLP